MLQELIKELRKHDRAEIAFKSGVSLGTINTLISGSNRDPKLSTLNALQAFIDMKKQEQGK